MNVRGSAPQSPAIVTFIDGLHVATPPSRMDTPDLKEAPIE